MKNTTVTIAILMSIAGTLYMPVFGMNMGGDTPSVIEGTPRMELDTPRRPRSKQVVPKSMASATTQAVQCNEILSDAGRILIKLAAYSVVLPVTLVIDTACCPIGFCTAPCRPCTLADTCDYAGYFTREALGFRTHYKTRCGAYCCGDPAPYTSGSTVRPRGNSVYDDNNGGYPGVPPTPNSVQPYGRR